jgi:RNA polymerase sigma-70 factor, ECF subfamily
VSHTALNEQDLVARMRHGEQKSFDAFFELYAARVSAFAARRISLDADSLEDIVQLTMIKAMRGFATFRGESSFFTWVCQICRNQIADLNRKSGRQPPTQSLEQLTESRLAETIAELTDFRDPLDECVDDSSRSAVRRTINGLPQTYARILELRYGDDLTILEVGRVLRLSESAVESRLVRARQAFRNAWCEKGAVVPIRSMAS